MIAFFDIDPKELILHVLSEFFKDTKLFFIGFFRIRKNHQMRKRFKNVFNDLVVTVAMVYDCNPIIKYDRYYTFHDIQFEYQKDNRKYMLAVKCYNNGEIKFYRGFKSSRSETWCKNRTIDSTIDDIYNSLKIPRLE